MEPHLTSWRLQFFLLPFRETVSKLFHDGYFGMKQEDTASTDSPTAKQPTSKPFVASRLTPSEIESLRKHGMQISTYARGKFADLFKK